MRTSPALTGSPTGTAIPASITRIRDRVISFEEEQKYLAAAGPNLRSLTILAVDTGKAAIRAVLSRMAAGPTGNLRLHAKRIINGYIKVREGKTKSAERILPLPPRAREVLLALRTDSRRSDGFFLVQGIQVHLTSIHITNNRQPLGHCLDRL